MIDRVKSNLEKTGALLRHLDSENDMVSVAEITTLLLETKGKPIVSANAYLGARALVKGLELSADIVVYERLADASPAVSDVWYWYKWH